MSLHFLLLSLFNPLRYGRSMSQNCAKRMAETRVHFLDNVLPLVPYRQFVISFPMAMRYWLHMNKKLLARVHRIIIDLILSRRSLTPSKDSVSRWATLNNGPIYRLRIYTQPSNHSNIATKDFNLKSILSTCSRLKLKKMSRLCFLVVFKNFIFSFSKTDIFRK